MDTISKSIGNVTTEWIRFSEYEFKTDKKNRMYIIPKKGSQFNVYNPFELSEKMLLNFISLGQKALEAESLNAPDEQLKNEILSFTQQFGLLGFINASVFNQDIIKDKSILFIENNYVTKNLSLSKDDYIKLFTPFTGEKEVFIKRHENRIGKVTFDIIKSDDSPKYYGKRPIIMDLVFSQFYGEEVEWILNMAKNYVQHLKQIHNYRKSSPYLNQEVTIAQEMFEARKIGFTISHKKKTLIAWEFDSLKTILDMIYAFTVSSEKVNLNFCENCNTIYLGSSTQGKYCSPICRNRANVKKSRSKKQTVDNK